MNLRGVWSFWSPPHLSLPAAWASEEDHCAAWVISTVLGSRRFTETVLHCDALGAEVLGEILRLPFARLVQDLDHLTAADVRWWALGKLHAYAAQDRPFVHVDADVFLHKDLPDHLCSAAVCAQSSEPFCLGDGVYRPERLRAAAVMAGGWVPEAWSRVLDGGQPLHGDCCGIIGGIDLECLHAYAHSAIRCMRHPANRRAWNLLGLTLQDMVSMEQFHLAAIAAERRVTVQYLFDEPAGIHDEERCLRLGYTHLIGHAKRHPTMRTRLHERCRALDSAWPGRIAAAAARLRAARERVRTNGGTA